MSALPKKIVAVITDENFRPLLKEVLTLYDINFVTFFDRLHDVPREASIVVVLDRNDEIQGDISGRDIFHFPVRMGVLIDRLVKLSFVCDDSFFIGAYHFNVAESALTKDNADPIRLTEKECALLLMLYQNHGKTVDHKKLLEDIWGYAAGIETHTLETHIYRLRQKIEKDPSHPEILITDEAGYRLSV